MYWSKDAIIQYYERNTHFAVTHQPIPPSDMPVMTICPAAPTYWGWFTKYKSIKYSYNHVIDGKNEIYEKRNVTFSMKNDNTTDEFLQWTLDDPDPTVIMRPICAQYSRVCLQISVDINKSMQKWGKTFSNKFADGGYLKLQIDFSKADYSEGEKDAIQDYAFWLFLSSNSNSFGVNQLHLGTRLPFSRFYGGNVDRHLMKTGRSINLVITSLNEFRHNYRCTKSTYYQTLAEQFMNKDFGAYKLMHKNLSCPHKYSYLPYTLTLDNDIPTWKLCPTDCNRCKYEENAHWKKADHLMKNCSQRALNIVQEEMEDFQLKECIFKDYGVKELVELKNHPTYGKLSPTEIGFTVSFLIAENSKPWYNKFTKTVHEEYLQTSWISLVGTVGGTLGLFVGISFLELGSWVQSKLCALARRIRRL